MQKRSWGIVLSLFFCFSFAVQAQVEVEGQSYIQVKDLKEDMLVFSEEYSTYIPYIKGVPFQASAAVFVLNLRQYQDYQLLVRAPAEAALLINQRIVDYDWHGGQSLYPLDSLMEQYGDSCVLSVFHPELKPSALEVAVISRYPYSYKGAEAQVSAEYLRVVERPRKSFSNFFIVGVLVLLAVLAILRNVYPKVFASYFDLSRAAALRVRDEANFTMKLSGRGHIPFILFYSLLFGFLLMALLHQIGDTGGAFYFLEDSSFASYLNAWALLAGVVFSFQLLKYWLLQIVGRVFSLQDFANIHFFDFLRLSQIFYTLLFVLIILLFFGLGEYADSGAVILTKVVAVFAFLRVLLIFFKLLHLSSFRKTYLFSYLCTTEILPLLVGLKFLIM